MRSFFFGECSSSIVVSALWFDGRSTTTCIFELWSVRRANRLDRNISPNQKPMSSLYSSPKKERGAHSKKKKSISRMMVKVEWLYTHTHVPTWFVYLFYWRWRRRGSLEWKSSVLWTMDGWSGKGSISHFSGIVDTSQWAISEGNMWR